MAIVPRLTGLNEADATAQALDRGFEIRVEQAESTEQSPGLVFQQDADWDEPMERGQTITVTIALEPEPEPEEPPVSTEPEPTETESPEQ